MDEIKNVLICGIGAIGSIYASIINDYDSEELRVLVDSKRLETYTKNPKIFNGQPLLLNYVLPCNNDFKADLIIIATKSNSLNDVIKNIENFVKKDTIIVSLLNGITSEEFIALKYGWQHVIHSYFIGHSAMRNGNIITYDGIGDIVFGIKNAEITDKNNILKLKNYFDKVGIKYKISDDIYRSMWLKYMLNVSCNQISAILNLTFGQMQSSKECRELIKNVMQEVLNLAKECGVKNTETMIDEAFISFDKMIANGKTSMLQDMDSGRKTEVDIFADTVIEYGYRYNIPTPYNKILSKMIKILENKNLVT